MPLTLKIVSFKGQSFFADNAAVFHSNGGTIGRSNENTLVLPDPEKFVSRRHATISFENGRFLITDCSLSGTYIDDQSQPLVNQTQPLMDGMLLKIGEYEIQVSLTSEQLQQDTGIDNFSPFFSGENAALSAGPSTDPFAPAENLLHSIDQADDLLNQLSSGKESQLFPPDNPFLNKEQEQSDFPGIMQENIASIHDSFTPPAPGLTLTDKSYAGNEIPDDFNFEELFDTGADSPGLPESDSARGFQNIQPTNPDNLVANAGVDDFLPSHDASNSGIQQPSPIAEKPPIETPAITNLSVKKMDNARPVNSSAVEQSLFNAFMQGAGIDNKQIEITAENAAEKMLLIGSMFRQLVGGAIIVLRSRAEFKSQFRVSVTTIKTADNNPLKFAVSTDDAICHLLNNGQGGFKNSNSAIDEGFNDIVSHQMAMQAGIQAALAELFSKFDPKLIEQQFSEGLVLQKKSKCWDKYVNLYPQIVEQTTEDFFGEAFAHAYEQQMKRLSGTFSKN